MYDVGAIVRDTQTEFRLFANTRNAVDTQAALLRNRATPEDLAILLAALASFTDELVEWRQKMDDNQDWRAQVLGAGGLEGLQIIDADLAAWQSRLDDYIFEVSKAPPGDRKDVLWSVTAPLLLGFYGGENSERPRAPADVGTPFAIANAMLVSDEFQSDAFEQWQSDTVGAAVDLVKGAGKAIARAVDDAGDAIDDAFDFAKLLGVLVPIAAVGFVINALANTMRRRR